MDHILSAILADPRVSPEFASAMALQSPDQTALPVRRAHLVAAMLRFDKQFEFSEDHTVWRRWRDELQRLREESKAVDPEGALWAANMPGFHRG